MAISHRYHTDRSNLALELTMRDALGGLEELVSMGAFGFDPACMEILGIEAPARVAPRAAAPFEQPPALTRVVDFPHASRRQQQGLR